MEIAFPKTKWKQEKSWKEQSAYSIRIHKNESVAERFKRETIMLILVYMNVASLTFLILWLCWDMIFRLISFFFVFFFVLPFLLLQNNGETKKIRYSKTKQHTKEQISCTVCSMVYLTNVKALLTEKERERESNSKKKIELITYKTYHVYSYIYLCSKPLSTVCTLPNSKQSPESCFIFRW